MHQSNFARQGALAVLVDNSAFDGFDTDWIFVDPRNTSTLAWSGADTACELLSGLALAMTVAKWVN
jgi:hypothetical protein